VRHYPPHIAQRRLGEVDSGFQDILEFDSVIDLPEGVSGLWSRRALPPGRQPVRMRARDSI